MYIVMYILSVINLINILITISTNSNNYYNNGLNALLAPTPHFWYSKGSVFTVMSGSAKFYSSWNGNIGTFTHQILQHFPYFDERYKKKSAVDGMLVGWQCALNK